MNASKIVLGEKVDWIVKQQIHHFFGDSYYFPSGTPSFVCSNITIIRSSDFIGTLINNCHSSTVKITVWTGCSHLTNTNLI